MAHNRISPFAIRAVKDDIDSEHSGSAQVISMESKDPRKNMTHPFEHPQIFEKDDIIA